MKFSHFFIDRPIFASVISILIIIIGVVSYLRLPITQYPEIVPPTITVTTSYPGASPEVIMNTVAAPIEQEINGVENMLYMESQCTSDGSMRISVTFETGMDIDMAQILVQNRVDIAKPRLPNEVQSIGVNVKKQSPDILLVADLVSNDGSRDKLYLTNYAITQMKDKLARILGVSEIQVFGAKEYSMRVWLNPDRLAYLKLSPAQVVNALREQNKQVAAGKLNQPPVNNGAAYELIINAQGRLASEDEFGEIIIKYTPNGEIVRLKDVARIELGSYTYGDESYFDKKASIALGFYQLPGANAIDTARRIKDELAEMSKSFPVGVEYDIGMDTTDYIQESINEVYATIFDAILLVVLVVMIFLQDWRAAIIPIFAIPVSLIGTFFVMDLFGFTINNLSLFGLVLAIGIVVDDAIVVVENVERNRKEGLGVKEATKKAMTQVQGALIAIMLVLSSVFIPTAFIEGISGAFYKQFALTIAASTIFSGIVSLTLSPALCAVLLKDEGAKKDLFTKLWDISFGKIFRWFNIGFDWVAVRYGSFVRFLTKISALVVICYAFLIYATFWCFVNTPKGFIPKQDMGYLFATLQLPDGASFYRTDEIVQQAVDMMMKVKGVKHTIGITGFSAATRSKASNGGAIFVTLNDHKDRTKKGQTAESIVNEMNMILNSQIKGASIFVLTPPAVNGIGVGGDFKFYVQDRGEMGVAEIDRYSKMMTAQINQLPEIAMAFSSYRVTTPQLYADIDRQRAQKLNVPISSIFETMQYNLGSIYVNDFNILGRVYRVVAQAEGSSRKEIADVYNLKVPNALGENVPLGSVANIRRIIGPDRTVRYNLYSSAEVQGNLMPGYSTGQAISAIENLAANMLPKDMGIEWTDLAFQEKRVGNTAILIFALCVLFVFLLLAALYESWTLPLSVVMVVPLVLLFSILGIRFRGMDNNIMTQIGFVVLIGLACKNAILIVEFAKQRLEKGEELVSSVSHASQNRLRPILMTSFAFIFGVVPLAYATGSGAELRQALGTSVLYGMIGVTIFGLVITPVAFYVIKRLVPDKKISDKSVKI